MKRTQLFLNKSQVEFLKSLPGTLSEHIRRAIDEYIDRVKPIKVSASQSKKVGE